MQPIGYAIVGAGNIARVHAEALQKLENARLIGIYDTVSANAERFAATYGIHCFPTYEDLLTEPAVEAVILCTPSGLRGQLALQGAAARKHLICEKPLEIDLAMIRRMIDACAVNGVTLTGIFNNRYNKVYQRVRQAAADGEFGRLLLGDVQVKWYRDPSYFQNSNWRGTWRYDGGGALMNQSIHFIDLLQWIMGPVAEIKALAATNLHPIEVEDTAAAVVRFANGALGVIEGTTIARPGLYDRLEIHGERGSVLVENGQIKYWNLDGRSLPDDEWRDLNQYELSNHLNHQAIESELHRLQLAEITDCLQRGAAPPLNGQEAMRAVETILRIYQSAGIRPSDASGQSARQM